MLRKVFNESVGRFALNVYSGFDQIIFLDTETSIQYMQTRYGLEWYPKIMTIQMAEVTGRGVTKTLVDGEDILPTLQYIYTLPKTALLVGYNILYDLYVVYRNIYMQQPNEPYTAITPIKAKILDLMVSYDMSFVTCLGKRDDHRETYTPQVIVKGIPQHIQHGNISLPEFLSTEIKQRIEKYVAPYSIVDVHPIKQNSNSIFDNLAIKVTTPRKLKHIMAILGETVDDLDDLGWANIKDLDEFSFILPEERKEEIDQAYQHNLSMLTHTRFWLYAERDIDYLFHLLYALGFPPRFVFHDEVGVQAYLRYIGIPVRSAKGQLSECIKAEQKLQEDINTFYGEPVNLNSAPQKKLLLQKLTGETPTDTTKDTIEKLSERFPHIDLLKRMATHGANAYNQRLLSCIDRMGASGLHPNELLSVTSTYRKAHIGSFPSVGIPRNEQIRSLFHISACGDQHGAELVVWQRYVNDPCLAKDLQANVDIHSKVLSTIMGVSYEEILRRKDEPEIKEARSLVKRITFASFYGGTEGGIAEKNNTTVEKIAIVLDAFTKNYPRFAAYREMTSGFNNMEKIAKNWHNTEKCLKELPIAVINVFGLAAYAALEKCIQLVLADVGNAFYDTLLNFYPAPIYYRKDRPQTVAGCVRSACLGAIATLQGDVKRRLMNNPIQSSVAVLTKHAKQFLFEHLGIPAHDVHDEILLPYIRKSASDAIVLFTTFVEKFKAVFPYLRWDLEETEIWKK